MTTSICQNIYAPISIHTRHPALDPSKRIPWYINGEISYFLLQAGDAPWNKGAIYNIGFNTILKIDKFDCFIFHDVDLLLENDKNYYGCNFTPAHLSVAVDTLKYK